MKYVFVIIALIALGAQALKADQRASQTLQDMVEAQALIRMPNVSVDDTKGAGAAAAASKVDETTDTGAATAASKVDETTDTGASKDTGSTDAGASKEDDVQGAEIPCKGFLGTDNRCFNNNGDGIPYQGEDRDSETDTQMMERVCTRGEDQYQKIPRTNVYMQCGHNSGYSTDGGHDHCYKYRCIPPKVSVDETTGAGAAAAASKKGWVLDILTDFGEETDDEVAVTAACLIALTDNTMQLNIMFLDEDPKAQKENLQAFLGLDDWPRVEKAANIAFYSSYKGLLKLKQLAVSAKEMNSAGKKHYVLQVGPIHGKPAGFDAYTSALMGVSYSYALVGTMGNTLNSKGTAEKAAAMKLWQHATSKAIVDTARGAGAFKFSYSVMKKFFEGKHALLDHVVKIGFRNTVGRADSKSGKFVANLVATQKSSANYQTVKSVEKSVGACTSATTFGITDGEEEGIAKVVNQYYKALTEAGAPLEECDTLLAESKALGGDWKAVHESCEACKQKTCASTTEQACLRGMFCNSSGKLNAPGNPTADQVKEGYAFILKTLKEQFNVPIDLIVSGKAGAWEKTWDGIDKKSSAVVPFKPQYSGIADDTFNEMVRKSFKTWKKKVETCDIPMTPNYDSVGLIYAMLEMHGGIGKEFACDKKNMNTCQLQSARVKSPASFGYFLSRYVDTEIKKSATWQ